MDLQNISSLKTRGCAGCQMVSDLTEELERKEEKLKDFNQLKAVLNEYLNGQIHYGISMNQIFNQIFINQPFANHVNTRELQEELFTLKKTVTQYDKERNKFIKQIKEQRDYLENLEYEMKRRIGTLENKLANCIILDDINTKFKDDNDFTNRMNWIRKQKLEYNNDLIVYKEIEDGFELLAHAKDEKAIYDKLEKRIQEGKLLKDDLIFFE